eukprot:105110_1
MSLLSSESINDSHGTISDEEHKTQNNSGWRDRLSLNIIMLVVFVGDMQRGILFPTLWPYVRMLGGDKISQGFVVAAFSAGRFVSSPIMGKLSVSEGYRMVLCVSLAIMVAGTLEYILASNIWMILFAQLMMGFGSGTLGVTRAYVAEKSLHEHRTFMLARLTAWQYAGFTCTPFIGAALSTWLGPAHNVTESNIVFNGTLRWEFDKYTAPAWCMCLMGIVAIILLNTVFVDSIPPEKLAKKAAIRGTPLSTPDTSIRKNISSGISLNRYGAVQQRRGEKGVKKENAGEFWAVVFGGFMANIVTKGSIACYETLAVEYAMSSFSWKSTDAGYTVACFGAVGVIALFSMRWLLKFANDIQLIIWGMVVMCGSSIILSLAPIVRQYTSQHSGKDSWLFFVSMFMMYSVGYPIGHTALIGLFSKVIGKRPQGEMMGWFGSCGSLSRVVFPIGAGIISQEMGTHTMFAVVGSLLALITIVAYIMRRKYVPYL